MSTAKFKEDVVKLNLEECIKLREKGGNNSDKQQILNDRITNLEALQSIKYGKLTRRLAYASLGVSVVSLLVSIIGN